MAFASTAENVFHNAQTEDRSSEQKHDDEGRNEYNNGRKGRFRFKSSSKSTSRRTRSDCERREDGLDDRPHKHHHRRRHHNGDRESDVSRHRSSKRHKTSSHHHRHHHHDDERDPIIDGGEVPNSAPHPRTLSPSAAFRESLFDALGDDEGASYWESVYGQPIHQYEKPSVPKGPNGELEQMSDEEYAAYVRARMWERSYEGMMEERERLRAERVKQRAREKKDSRYRHEERERMQFEEAIEASLKRGAERRKVKTWKVAWEAYLKCWDKMNGLVLNSTSTLAAADDDSEVDEDGLARETGKNDKNKKPRDEGTRFRNLIFWPVESGKRKDVSRNAVEEFMRHAPPPLRPTTSGDESIPKPGSDSSLNLLATLKAERVRWHPDKIQHRYGVLGIDDTVMRSVTEVFQIVDRMWNEERTREKR